MWQKARRMAILASIPGRKLYGFTSRSVSKMGPITKSAAIWATRSEMLGTDTANCTTAQTAFGFGRDHPSLSSAPGSAVRGSEAADRLGGRVAEPAASRSGQLVGGPRLDRLGCPRDEPAGPSPGSDHRRGWTAHPQ